jgi:fatty acid desaturase
VTTTDTTESVRKRIKADLPEKAFERRPWRALWYVPLAAIVISSLTYIIAADPAWYIALALALVAGQGFAGMGFLTHETLHGATVANRRLQDFLGLVGFGPVLVSPTLWRTWHNQVHHGKTNMGNSDPDSFGTLTRYEKAPSTRFVTKLAPGSGHWMSYLFFFYWFTFHGQIVLWLQARYVKSFKRLNRRRAIIDSAVCAVIWIVVAVVAGPVGSIFAIVIPLMVYNFTIMSYIATNHFMRPMADTNDPLDNSMSVNTLPIIDRLHFNFSHHVEHHLFPTMSAASAPAVREWLLENEPKRYVSPPHIKAFLALYQTPRVFTDATTLVHPDHPEDSAVNTTDLAEKLVGFRPVTESVPA